MFCTSNRVFKAHFRIILLKHYNKKTPPTGEFGIDCIFLAQIALYYCKFKLIFAMNLSFSAAKSYIPSYLRVVLITELIPMP